MIQYNIISLISITASDMYLTSVIHPENKLVKEAHILEFMQKEQHKSGID